MELVRRMLGRDRAWRKGGGPSIHSTPRELTADPTRRSAKAEPTASSLETIHLGTGALNGARTDRIRLGSRSHRESRRAVANVHGTAVLSAANEVARMDYNDSVGIRPHAGDQDANTTREPVSDGGAGGLTPSFLAELARAMQAAAELERQRIAAVVADHAAEHVEKTRTRAAAETEQLRRLAAEDVDRIQTWLADETERIRREAERRAQERRNDLEALLAEHDWIIATEIDSVGAAVREYRSTLDQFFDALMGENNPVSIARHAGSLPAPPDLDAVRGAARAGAVARLAEEVAHEATDEAMDDGRGRAEADRPTSADADLGDDQWAEVGAGLAVMDPEAVGRSEDLPGAPEEVGVESESEPPTAPPEAPSGVPVGHAIEGADAGSVARSGPAARLLRSIAPWTMPVGHDERDRGTHNHRPTEF